MKIIDIKSGRNEKELAPFINGNLRFKERIQPYYNLLVVQLGKNPLLLAQLNPLSMSDDSKVHFRLSNDLLKPFIVNVICRVSYVTGF